MFCELPQQNSIGAGFIFARGTRVDDEIRVTRTTRKRSTRLCRCRSQRRPLFVDEPGVMLQVVAGRLQDLQQRERPGDVVDAAAGERLFGKTSQDAGHLPTNVREQRELLVDVPLVAAEPGDSQALVRFEECRLVRGDDPLHAIGIDAIRVNHVADDFQRAPAAGDGTGAELVERHLADACRKMVGAVEVLVNTRLHN